MELPNNARWNISVMSLEHNQYTPCSLYTDHTSISPQVGNMTMNLRLRWVNISLLYDQLIWNSATQTSNLWLKNQILESTLKSSNQYANAQIHSLSMLQAYKNTEIQCQIKPHSSRIQSGRTAFSAELIQIYQCLFSPTNLSLNFRITIQTFPRQKTFSYGPHTPPGAS